MPFTLVASPKNPLKRRLISFWKIVTNSRNCVPLDRVTVIWARVPEASFQEDPLGSMMSAPIAPLFECLIGSDDERFVAPNSIGVGTPVLFAPVVTSPAYHW